MLNVLKEKDLSMEISKHIKKESVEILESNKSLPYKISSAPEFYVARADDSTIHAFGAIMFDGITYKIGVKTNE